MRQLSQAADVGILLRCEEAVHHAHGREHRRKELALCGDALIRRRRADLLEDLLELIVGQVLSRPWLVELLEQPIAELHYRSDALG